MRASVELRTRVELLAGGLQARKETVRQTRSVNLSATVELSAGAEL